MTFAQMRTEAELLYESINSSAAPGFTTAEWGTILTAAQRRIVRNILKEGVTRDSFNILSIERLIKYEDYLQFDSDEYYKNSDGSQSQKLDEPFDTTIFWVLDEYVNTVSKGNIPLIRRSFDYYRTNIGNPFRTPNSDDGFWIIQRGNTPIFITDGTEINKYLIMAVEHPDNYPIDSTHDCILNIGVHSDIVEEAVKLARMSVDDPQGYQLALAQFSK
jgi:hypothetical protein